MTKLEILKLKTRAQIQEEIENCSTLREVVHTLTGSSSYYWRRTLAVLEEKGVSLNEVRARSKESSRRKNVAVGKKTRLDFSPSVLDKVRIRAAEIFIENSPTHPNKVRQYLFFWNPRMRWLEYKCQDCGNPGFHNGKDLRLQIDHKNGIGSDNRLENLRFLCPNCHSQTETFCGRNIKNKKRNPGG